METLKDIIIPVFSILASIAIAYYTSRYVYKKQFEDGKILILEILKRYIININNNYCQGQGTNRQVKTSALDKEFYLTELKSIYADIKLLLGNPILIKSFKKHPKLTMLIITLGREIVELEQPNSSPGVNTGTLKEFLDLYDVIKSEFKKGWFENDKHLKEINDIAEYFKKQI